MEKEVNTDRVICCTDMDMHMTENSNSNAKQKYCA